MRSQTKHNSLRFGKSGKKYILFSAAFAILVLSVFCFSEAKSADYVYIFIHPSRSMAVGLTEGENFGVAWTIDTDLVPAYTAVYYRRVHDDELLGTLIDSIGFTETAEEGYLDESFYVGKEFEEDLTMYEDRTLIVPPRSRRDDIGVLELVVYAVVNGVGYYNRRPVVVMPKEATHH